MKTFYYLAGTVFGLYLTGVASVVYDNHYKPHKELQRLKKTLDSADRGVELAAAKKRHPASKRRG